LKQKNQSSKSTQPAAKNSGPPQTPPISSGAAVLSRRRRWLFRLCALTLAPLLILSGFELALRLSGFGHPTTFFLRTQISGRDFYVPNDKFGLLFFPPTLVRSPLPMRMPAVKPANTFRIFLFGESAAQGDPDPTFGFGRYLEVLLRERYPGVEFEVVCVAMTAINSHAILRIARECAGRQGDLWLIYMGNNEMVGPFGAGTVFGAQAPRLGLIRAGLALKTTKLGQALEALVARFKGGSAAYKSWGGMKMFMDHQLHDDDPGRLRVYGHFQQNLEDILRAARNAGVPVVLSTVASNLKDCAPFASLHAATLDETRKAAWEDAFQNGLARESEGAWPNALARYSNAAALDPQFAELQFRLGMCHLALTNNSQARRDFELARDCDTLAFRADTRINQIIKNAASRHAGNGIYALDAVEALSQYSPAGIPGQELFYEHVHFHFDGNYLLARAFANKIAGLLPASINARAKTEWPAAEICDRRLAVTIWDRHRLWQNNLRRLFEPPFTNQSDHGARVKMYRAKLDEIEARMNSESPELSRKIYEAAVAAAPEDYFLRANFAEFLEATGDSSGALTEQQRVHELLPGEPMPSYKIGRLLVRQGKTTEAAEYFLRALALRRGFLQALDELGVLRANQQRTEEAADYFNRALRKDPNYAETSLDLGFMEQTEGKLDQAMAHYQEAARLEAEGPAAYFYQGVNLAAHHQRGEAVASFREALRLKPGFWQAGYLLGVELAGQEKVTEAQAQFLEVLRLRPDYARAHLNLGVALAKQGRLDEALTEFTTTLRLNPANKLASQHIATIKAMQNPSR
jgi:tetratricopeptide (TPR) repeat protein